MAPDVPSESSEPPSDYGIAIISHNYGRFLHGSILSALRQTVPPTELVVVDDGSTDSTSTVALQYRSDGVRLVHHARALGPAGAFNSGIDTLSTDIVLKLDADDQLAPDYAQRTLEQLQCTRSDFAYGDIRYYGTQTGGQPGRRYDVQPLSVQNYIPGTAMMTRALYTALGGFDPYWDRWGWEDWDFWIRAAKLGATGSHAAGAELWVRRHEVSRNVRTRRRWWLMRYLMWRRHPDFVTPPPIVERAAGYVFRRT